MSDVSYSYNHENKTNYITMAANSASRVLRKFAIEEKVFDEMKDIKYLGNILNFKDIIKDTFQERINLGNCAYFANLRIFKSKLISINTKFKIYTSLV